MDEKCLDCRHCVPFYFTENKNEIEELKKKEIHINLELFVKVAKEKVDKPKVLIDYVKTINPFNTDNCDFLEGFMRFPKDEMEARKSRQYCIIDRFEPTEIEECEGCDRFERK